MERIGLVLGAGGVVGQAYHAGVLAALQHDHGLDARRADLVVGTSAGAITGALLRLEVSATDLASWVQRLPLTEDGEIHRRMALAPVPDLPPIRPLHLLLRPARPPTRHMVRRAIVRPWQFRPLAAGLALLAPGRDSIEERLAPLRGSGRPEWPARSLWICAVRRRDGRRIVFGRPGSPPASLEKAVAASCAVPGYFAPVEIGGHTYVDGGAHSPTNAALLRGCDLVVVVSPMSGPPGIRPDFHAAARRHAARLLRREIAALRAAGTRVLVFSPGPEEQEVMGDDVMSAARLDEVVHASSAAASRRTDTLEARRLLRLAAEALRRAPSGPGSRPVPDTGTPSRGTMPVSGQVTVPLHRPDGAVHPWTGAAADRSGVAGSAEGAPPATA
ncbi:patatin-like phospholipase family protein [Geodermatophilus sp. SYSU D00684]